MKLAFTVRDYECDLQGIVNNAVYQNYFEHARHKWLKSVGLDFAAAHQEGYDLVVYRIEIDYKRPLKSGDEFEVISEPEIISDIRIKFTQRIICNQQEMAVAVVWIASVYRGKPKPYPKLMKKLNSKYLQSNRKT